MNITAIKTATLQSLTRQYNDATTIAAKAQALYDSYVNKAQLFQGLYTQAVNDQVTTNGQWTQFLALKSSLLSLTDTSDECDLVSQVAHEQIKMLVRKWEQVVQKTIEAADTINLVSGHINNRKPLFKSINSDLVTDATLTANNAVGAVNLVINALTVTLNTLTMASQSANSSNLTSLYIDLATAALLAPKQIQPQGEIPEPSHIPLEVSLSDLHTKAALKKQSTAIALEKANAEMAASKEELNAANAKVVTAQAALKAALDAVTG